MSLLSRIVAAVSVCGVSVAPAPAFAQTHAGLGEISAGYMFLRDTSDQVPSGPKVNFPVGWYVSGAVNPTGWLGLVGEVSGSHRNNIDFTITSNETYSYSTDAQIYTVLGGPRFFHKAGRVAPFAQVLAGVAHTRLDITLPQQFGSATRTSNATHFAIQPGGGVTVYMTEHAGIRVAGDYRSIINVSIDEENTYANQFRFVTGFTWEWGAR